MMIRLTPFGGLVPKIGKRLLPNEGATAATNLKIQSGELRPMRHPGLVYTPLTPKNGLQISIFNARNGASADDWFTWPIDVDCVRVPLATDVESRFCWTGDGPPKMITYTNAISGAGSNYPLLANELSLGIPTPQTAPGVSHSGGTGSAATRFYRYTFFSQNGEESSPSPISAVITGKVDGTWSISALDEVPANSGVGTATATRFTNTALKHWLRVGDEVYFSSAPTVARTVTAIFSATAFDVAGASIAAETAWSRKTPWNTAGMTKRLYRTTGTTGSWQLVNEVGIAAATTTYDDTLTDALIAGDELISEGWVPPPVGLKGLCVHPSGSLLGFVNNLLCASEPYQPHAWPEAYQLASGYNAVGLAVFGSTAVMATAGMPFVATGVEPASMTGEDVQGMYPCLSKRGVISAGDRVLYPSLHGYVQVGAQGVSLFSEPWFTKDEWALLNPETMISATAYGRVYTVYTNDDGLQSMLCFDGPILTSIEVEASELYADVSSGELYISKADGISIWDDPLEVPMRGSWQSRDFVFPKPINIGAGKIEFDAAIDPAIRSAILAAIAATTAANALLVPTPGNPLTATLSDALGGAFADDDYCGVEISGCNLATPIEDPPTNEVSVTLFAGDGSLLDSKNITNTLVFRLKSGYKKDVFSVQVTGQCVVKEIRLAETPSELAVA